MSHAKFVQMLVVLAVAAIVGVSTYVHGTSTAEIYGKLQTSLHDGSQPVAAWAAAPTGTGAVHMTSLAREGAQWARRAVLEAYIWGAVLLVVGLIVVRYFLSQ